ncbi:hypothetical protein KY310_04880 [Candidatus Woesearchaeota archaeon]|nr:hypothetical protein [Candidatus Woesearchaeota archaeon]
MRQPFYYVKRAWQIWREVVNERKAQEKADKEGRALFQKVLAQKDRVEKLQNQMNAGDFEAITESLEDITEQNSGLPQEERFSPEKIKDALYTVGKNQAALVYAQHGVDPVNLAFIIHNVAKSQEKLLGEKLNPEEYTTAVHQHMVGLAKTYLRSIRGKPSIASEVLSAMQRAEQILELANYTPEEKHKQTRELNKHFASALLPSLKGLAFQGLVSEFEDVRKKVYKAMDIAQIAPELRKQVDVLTDIYHGKCYNEHFKNHVVLFMQDLISLEELDKIAKEHNRVFDALDIAGEDIELNRLLPVARLNANTYRVGINNLLYRVDPASRNGNPIPPEKEAKDMAARIKKYLAPAELKTIERKGVVKALRRIDSFYNGHSNGHNSGDRNGRYQMYKNPLYDRRARQLTKKHR